MSSSTLINPMKSFNSMGDMRLNTVGITQWPVSRLASPTNGQYNTANEVKAIQVESINELHDAWDMNPVIEETTEIKLDSVLRKRRLKMKKHKLRKRRRTQRALKKRLGK